MTAGDSFHDLLLGAAGAAMLLAVSVIAVFLSSVIMDSPYFISLLSSLLIIIASAFMTVVLLYLTSSYILPAISLRFICFVTLGYYVVVAVSSIISLFNPAKQPLMLSGNYFLMTFSQWIGVTVSCCVMRSFSRYKFGAGAYAEDFNNFFRISAIWIIAVYLVFLITFPIVNGKNIIGDSSLNLVLFGNTVPGDEQFMKNAAVFFAAFRLMPFGFYYALYRGKVKIPELIILPIILSSLLELYSSFMLHEKFGAANALIGIAGFIAAVFLKQLADYIHNRITGGEEKMIFPSGKYAFLPNKEEKK